MSSESVPKLGRVYHIPRSDQESDPGAGSSYPSGPTSFASFASFAGVEAPDRMSDEAFHGICGDIARCIEPHTEADPHAILMQLLVAFGNCVGRGPFVRVESDRHFPNHFVVLVGRSSKARKGTSLGYVRSGFRAIDPDWEAKNIQSGLSSGEGVIWAVRDPIYKTSKGKEALDDLGVSDKRLLISLPEFASLLKIMMRQGNTLSPVVRQAWDGDTLQILTKNSPARATDSHLSIIGHITEDEAPRLLTETEAANGFANRFLWLCVRRTQLLPEGGNVPRNQLDPLYRALKEKVEIARRQSELGRTEAFRKRWNDVYRELAQDRPGLVGAITARAEAQVLRLSMTYALADGRGELDLPHLEAAHAAWRYCDASAIHIFQDALGDPIADRILNALRNNSGGHSRTMISTVLGRHAKKTEIEQALGRLLQAGLVRTEPRPSDGGRTAEWWFATGGTDAK